MTNKAQRLLPALIATLILAACQGKQSPEVNKTSDSNNTSSVTQTSPQPDNGKLQECHLQLFQKKVAEKDAAFNCANIYPENPKLVFIDNETTEKFARNLEDENKKKVLPFLIPLQTIQAGISRAHLQFNEGSAYRADYRAKFKFEPNSRRSTIEEGGVLVLLENNTGLGNFKTSVRTPEIDGESKSTAYIVRRNAKQKRTAIYVLTEGPVQVSAKGKSVQLRAGESIVGTQTGLEEKQPFDICQFYATEDLVRGLGPFKIDLEFVAKLAPSLQRTYHVVRSETILAYWQSCPQEVPVYRECPTPNLGQ